MNIHQAAEQLKAVLCNPEGEVCISGSAADRKIIKDALATLAGDAQQKAVGWAVLTLVNGEWKLKPSYILPVFIYEEAADDFAYKGNLEYPGEYMKVRIFPHPPAATALAQEVKDKAVEICDTEHDGYNAPRHGWDMTNAVHAEYAGYQRACCELAEKIDAIPIQEPRPDALEVIVLREQVAKMQALLDASNKLCEIASARADRAGRLAGGTQQAATLNQQNGKD